MSKTKKIPGESMDVVTTDQKLDSKRRITLPKIFEGCDHVIVEQVSDVEIRIIRANLTADLSSSSKAMLLEGIEDAKAGRMSELTDDLLAEDEA